MKIIKEWLKNNIREVDNKIELELLYMAINLYHVLSLIWDRTTRKYTNDFLIYKTQEILECFIYNLPENIPMEIIEERIEEGRNVASKEAKNIEDLMIIFGAEVDNYPGSQYGLSLDLKISLLLHGLNLIGISDKQIFEKYQN